MNACLIQNNASWVSIGLIPLKMSIGIFDLISFLSTTWKFGLVTKPITLFQTLLASLNLEEQSCLSLRLIFFIEHLSKGFDQLISGIWVRLVKFNTTPIKELETAQFIKPEQS